MGHAVLTAVGADASHNSRDVELLAQGQLVIRLVDGDGNDVQRADAGLDAVWLQTVVVASVGSLFGDRVSTMAALQIRADLHDLKNDRLQRQSRPPGAVGNCTVASP
jgi:hypothetical protein